MSHLLIKLLEGPTPKNLAPEAAIYARFSSENQDESSIVQQVHRCKEFATKEGNQIPDQLVFSDEAISGANPNRPGLLAMVQAASEGRFSTLYVDSLSRLARDTTYSMLIISYFKSIGIRIVSVSENTDSTRPGSELDTGIRSVLHDEHGRTHSSNVQRGQEGTIRNGHSCGDYVFGYLSEGIPGTEYGRRGQRKSRRRIIIDEQNAKMVLWMFERYALDIWSVSRIIRELNRRGIKKDHRSTRPSWDHSNVLRVLRNPKYVGIWVWVKPHESVIPSKVLFARYRVGRHKANLILDFVPTFRSFLRSFSIGLSYALHNRRRSIIRPDGAKASYMDRIREVAHPVIYCKICAGARTVGRSFTRVALVICVAAII